MGEVALDLEGKLDRLIGRLTKPGAPREAKALVLDARRLRTLVGNWRTIAPTDEARKEMTNRVELLERSADAVLPAEEPPPPEPVVAPRTSAAPAAPARTAPASPPPVAPARHATPILPPPAESSAPPPARGSTRPRAIQEEVRSGAIAEPYARRGAPLRPPVDAAPARVDAAPARVDAAPARMDAAPARVDAAPARVDAAPARQVTPLRPAPEWEEPPSLVVPTRNLLGHVDEPTRAAPIATMVQAGEERAAARSAADRARASAASTRPNGPSDPERLRTLPDLDISGLAQLLDDGPPIGFDDTLDTPRPTVARNTRVDFDGLGRRPTSEPPPRNAPSPPPANGKRRGEPAMVADASRSPNRPSRILIDADNESDVTGAPVVPSGDDVAQRASPRPSSSPPNVARSDKTLIAVRPLPAPEVLDKRLVMLTEPYSPRADAFRALRRKLSGPGAPRTIAVTSAQPDEGKTSCAVNLALAFRETSSERVLLMEANLRAPALAKLFGFEPPVCFAKQMAKNRDTAKASWTVAEQFEPLHVLAVDPSSKTSPLLDPVAFANALEQLVEAGYDHIIIDTPPALGGSDVNLIADTVDGIVVAAWIKKSKRSLVKKAIEQLKPATILGVVTLEG